MFVFSEVREAVVHVDKPWGDVTIQRKLPPLKYYYDLEISECVRARVYCDGVAYISPPASSLWSMAYGPCLEPGLAQANNSFSKSTHMHTRTHIHTQYTTHVYAHTHMHTHSNTLNTHTGQQV